MPENGPFQAQGGGGMPPQAIPQQQMPQSPDQSQDPGPPRDPQGSSAGPNKGAQGTYIQQIRAFSADASQIEEVMIELQKHVLEVRQAMPPDRQELASQAMAQLINAQTGLAGARAAMEMALQSQRHEGIEDLISRWERRLDDAIAESEESYSDLAKEHSRLVKVLRSPSRSDDKEEAKTQGRELKKYLAKARNEARGHGRPYAGASFDSDDLDQLAPERLTPDQQKKADRMTKRGVGKRVQQKWMVGKDGSLTRVDEDGLFSGVPQTSIGIGRAANMFEPMPWREYEISRIKGTDENQDLYQVARIGEDLRTMTPVYVTFNKKTDTWSSSMRHNEDRTDTTSELVKRWINRGCPPRIHEYMQPEDSRVGIQANIPMTNSYNARADNPRYEAFDLDAD